MSVQSLLHILIADDVADWRVQVRFMLPARPVWQLMGEACDGLQAVQRTMELRPDIVILDIGMPMLNGIEAAKRIRQGFSNARLFRDAGR